MTRVDGFDPATSFGPEVARQDVELLRGDEAAAVAFLAERAGVGPALELAIGTGRIALPLAATGVAVEGIELSPHMAGQLKARPGGDAIDVVVADMSSARISRRFSLVYVVFNSIFNLLTQASQIRCFENAAAHLDDGGVFVVEAAVPSAWTRQDDYVNAEHVGKDEVVLDVCRYDATTQLLEENHVHLSSAGLKLAPIVCRLIWPAEMDLMARIAGLRLVERWGGWQQEPFTSKSELHVSVYARS